MQSTELWYNTALGLSNQLLNISFENDFVTLITGLYWPQLICSMFIQLNFGIFLIVCRCLGAPDAAVAALS